MSLVCFTEALRLQTKRLQHPAFEGLAEQLCTDIRRNKVVQGITVIVRHVYSTVNKIELTFCVSSVTSTSGCFPTRRLGRTYVRALVSVIFGVLRGGIVRWIYRQRGAN